MVRWGSTALAVSNISEVSLTALVPARLIASAGAATVTVSTTGRTAISATFTISSPPATKTTQTAVSNSASGTTSKSAVSGNPPPTISGLITNSGTASGTALAAVTSITLPPTISSLSPSATIAGGAAFTLTINGANFTSTSTASWGGASLTTTYISATQMTASVPASLIAAAGTASIMATNSGGSSAGTAFTVNPPKPTITSLTPNSIMAGAQTFTLTINGTNFLPGNLGSVVTWSYFPLATTYVSSTQLTAIVPAPQVASAGTANIWVITAGGSSNTVPFTINPLPPIITSLSPAQIPAGSGAFTLSFWGSNFSATPTITFGTTPLAATKEMLFSIVVPASLITTAGPVNVTVTTAGGTTTAVFTVTPPLPVITSLSPASAPAGSAAFTLTINGTNLLPTSQVYLKSSALPTTYVSATQLTTVVPARILASATAMGLELYTTGLGSAGWSGSLPFTVTPAPPTITSLSPSSATAGGAGFMLTIKGTAFTPAATSMWGTTPLNTIYISPTQLTASIPASLIEFAGTASLTASTGAGTSPPVTFTIKPAPPVIGGLSPNLATAGGAAFTLTIYGNFFTPTSTSKWGSTALTTTYVSPTQLTAAVPAKLIAAAGTANVSVTTALGTAPSAAFIIYPAPKIITTALPSGTVGYDYSGPITVTGGVPGYTWTVTGLPSSMSYTNTSDSTMTITGTPAVSGAITFQVSAQDNVGNTAGPVTFNLHVAAGPSGANNASLNGSYACLLQGSIDEDGSRWASVASFQADGQGNFTSGIFDTNSHDVGSASGILTGRYNIGADNNGQASLHTTLTNNAAGIQTIQWAIALSGSAQPAQHFRMVESDDLGELPSGQQATANCFATTPSAFAASAISGHSFAFALDGEDNNSNLKSTVGLFRASAASSASGYLDTVLGGSSTVQSTAFTATYTAPDPASGRFTLALNGAGNSTGFTVYIIDASRMFILDNTSDDGEQAGEMRTQQQAAYSAANIEGSFVLYGRGAEFNGSGGTPSAFYATLSQGAADGAGNLTINQSYTNNAGSYSTGNTVGNPSALAFDSVHPGRATLPSAGGVTYLYLFNANSAFEMTVQDNGSFDSGALEPQSLPSSQSTFSDASLAGQYLSGELPLLSLDANAGVGVYNLSASGAITTAITLAGQDQLAWDQPLSTSYAWDSTAPGTGTFLIANGPQGEASCAVINTTKFACASQTVPAPSLQLMQE